MSTDPTDSQSDGEGAGPNSPWGGPSRRGLKVRKHEDHGIHLFRAALDRLAEPESLARTLLELTRCYDPVADAPVLDPTARRTILDLSTQGRAAEARGLLEAAMAEYARRADPP
jgi:hypothetical protein